MEHHRHCNTFSFRLGNRLTSITSAFPCVSPYNCASNCCSRSLCNLRSKHLFHGWMSAVNTSPTMPTIDHDAQSRMRKPAQATTAIHYPFWFGGSAASMAAVVTHPLDLVKVRLQTRAADAPKTMLRTFTYILGNEGPFGLYAGLSAALLRQMTYSTVRFGVYEDLKARFASGPDKHPSTLTLIAMSSTSGLLGGIAGNPGDILNVRMQSDLANPPDKRRNYKHALDGMVRMIREEGPSSLFRGVGANSARALLMTSSQLASYDVFKQSLVDSFRMADNLTTHFFASLAAAFVATTVCSPVDVIKTRIMSAGEKASILEILGTATRTEGWLWMFRGWTPSFIRLGPQTVITMIFFEQHKKIYRQFKERTRDEKSI